MINAIGNILGGGSARTSYAKQLAKAYEVRVIADGGVVESLGCFTAFAEALGAYQPPIALAATGVGETSFTANWKTFKGAKYYLLDVSTSPTFDTFVYEDEKINAPTTSYVVIGLNSNTTYYYRVRASTFEVEYGDVLGYAMSQGFTLPSAGQQTLQNQLLVDLKAGGIWNKLDTFGVFATDGDSDFALIDWKRLSDYTALNSPTFTTNEGFTGNGTSAYIDTNFNPSTSGVNYTLNDASISIWNNTFILNDFISGTQPSAFNVIRLSSSSANIRINMSLNILTPVVDFSNSSKKFRQLNRTSSTNVSAFQNTTSTTHTGNSTIVENQNQVILAGTIFYSSAQVSFFGMGASLVSQNTAFYNALNTYITSL